jgi:SpoVK/Ycf46/Vps4 family AAA+-type ATPase
MPRRSAPRGPTSDRSAPAERCGASRRSGDAWALPLLNLSDGIIASTFDSRVLVTTNARHTEIDPAILRPGRLCRHVAVPPLHADHATGLLRNLLAAEPRAPFRKPVTLAEVYAAAHGERERHA